MKFEDKLNDMFDEIEVPDELSPANIALMLKAKNEQSKMVSEHFESKSSPSITVQRRNIIKRTVAASAACAVFAVGMLAYNKTNPDNQDLPDRTLYQDITPVTPDSYDTLYDIYTGISLDSTTQISETNINTESDVAPFTHGTNITEIKPSESAITTTEPVVTYAHDLEKDDLLIEDERVSNADIVKTDGVNLYCISDGMLYVIDIATMKEITTIKFDVTPPVELYVEGDTLIIISTETEEIQLFSSDEFASDANSTLPDESVPADNSDTYQNGNETDSNTSDNSSDTAQSDANGAIDNDGSNSVFNSGAAHPGTTAQLANTRFRSNVIVDIFDISDKTFPSHTTSYKQSGSYIWAAVVDGTLYTVTSYSDYRIKPLDSQAELDSFVPLYYIDGTKNYIAPNDIIIPVGANSTDYTVVSAINLNKQAEFFNDSLSIKAVLGSSKNVCCSADSIFIAGVEKSNSSYTVITRFSLNKSGDALTYAASASVEGALLSSSSMNTDENYFRIATKAFDENGLTATSLYILDKTLTVTKSAGGLLPEYDISKVRFQGNYASLYLIGKNEPEMVIDLSCTPPIQVHSLDYNSAYIMSYNSDELIGLSLVYDDNGIECGIKLSMYSSENCLLKNSVQFAEDLTDINSKALGSRRALLIDYENSLIGVPVYGHHDFGTVNRYYLFTYDESAGFIPKGVGFIEYNDIDDSMIFERAVINGEIIYIIGNHRIVSARLSDMKVIDSIIY